MRKFFLMVLTLSSIVFTSCSKNPEIKHEVYPQVQVVPGQWRQMLDTSVAELIQQAYFSIGNKGFIINQQNNEVYEYDATSNTLTKKSNFPGSRREGFATAFSIGNRGYYGLGLGIKSLKEGAQTEWSYEYRLDFWEYNPDNDGWIQKKSLPGIPNVTGKVAFFEAFGIGIGGKGYVGLGRDINFSILNHIHEYDPATDNWGIKIDTFPAGHSTITIAFAIGNKGYIGDSTSFYEYDPKTSSRHWKKLSNIPSSSLRYPALSLASSTKGYVYGSISTLNNLKPELVNDFWEFKPDGGNGIWTQLANFKGVPRAGCAGFSLNNKIFLTFGSTLTLKVLSDVWEYSPM